MGFSICNEVFGRHQELADWKRICEFVAGCGYTGIEIAPFTFATDVTEIDAAARHAIRAVAADCGLEIVGLHWLLAGPPGLHINACDEAVRQRAIDYLGELARFAGAIGAPVMIFGSPKQRFVEDDTAAARQRMIESFREVLPVLEERDVILCQEALPVDECDLINTTPEAWGVVQEVDHPHFRLMLDVKSMCAEGRPPAEVIGEFGAEAAHVHLNDANRRAPGYGETDFRPIAAALKACGYAGRISIEPFDYRPSPEVLARETLAYLNGAFDV